MRYRLDTSYKQATHKATAAALYFHVIKSLSLSGESTCLYRSGGHCKLGKAVNAVMCGISLSYIVVPIQINIKLIHI